MIQFPFHFILLCFHLILSSPCGFWLLFHKGFYDCCLVSESCQWTSQIAVVWSLSLILRAGDTIFDLNWRCQFYKIVFWIWLNYIRICTCPAWHCTFPSSLLFPPLNCDLQLIHPQLIRDLSESSDYHETLYCIYYPFLLV